MDLLEYLQCVVCRELKPNPQETKCCNKLFCLECFQSLTNTRVCSICQQETSFVENTFASQLINIKLSDDSMFEDDFNIIRTNLPQTILNRASNYLSRMTPNSDRNRSDPNAFYITILNLEDRRIKIFVEKSDTIKIIKYKFEQKDGTAPEHQRLIFRGKQLEDHLTISHYKIETDSVIHFVKRYNGS
ncbi:10969_t:CDS:2 [Funneliformis caledonium]|uniref:10969_t:CDS:1 n=2 Tax=Funneliformis TaxID=1117308 RepID=A0A9N9IM80_9GLOM|nr:16671_t:CDS:2 [Funneliformis mosseae]CAG8740597.1 10969_t:CDS:2 [Funneliformis caledonium]